MVYMNIDDLIDWIIWRRSLTKLETDGNGQSIHTWSFPKLVGPKTSNYYYHTFFLILTTTSDKIQQKYNLLQKVPDGTYHRKYESKSDV